MHCTSDTLAWPQKRPTVPSDGPTQANPPQRMSGTTPPTIRCPTCKAQVPWTPESQHRPFCSARCKLIDLGAWATEERSIPGADQRPEDPAVNDEPHL